MLPTKLQVNWPFGSFFFFFFFFFFYFNLNTQCFVHLEFVKYQLGLHRNVQVSQNAMYAYLLYSCFIYRYMYIQAFFLYRNKSYTFLILGLAKIEYWSPLYTLTLYPYYNASFKHYLENCRSCADTNSVIKYDGRMDTRKDERKHGQ